MKRSILLSIIVVLMLVVVVGCSNKKVDISGIENKNISCNKKTEDGENFEEHNLKIDQDNKLLEYVMKKPIKLSSSDEYEAKCEELKNEYANSKINRYGYFTYSIGCVPDDNIVVITETYDVTKMKKESLPTDILKKSISDKLILDVSTYIELEEKDGYKCK